MDNKITVCDECLRASCWQGYFMCDNSNLAGTTEKTKEELIKLDLEHPDHWEYDTAKSRFRKWQKGITNIRKK